MANDAVDTMASIFPLVVMGGLVTRFADNIGPPPRREVVREVIREVPARRVSRSQRVVKSSKPKAETKWKASLPAEERRELVLDAHKGDYLAAAKSLERLAKSSTNAKTRIEATKDSKYFYRQNRIEEVD